MSGGGFELIIILFFFGLSGAWIARIKGGSMVMWFFVAACLPFIGTLAAVLYRYENAELRRQCPHCERVVMLYDAVCMHCGEELEFPDVAIAPATRMQRH